VNEFELFLAWLYINHACIDAQEFATEAGSFENAYRTCNEPEWLMWFLYRVPETYGMDVEELDKILDQNETCSWMCDQLRNQVPNPPEPWKDLDRTRVERWLTNLPRPVRLHAGWDADLTLVTTQRGPAVAGGLTVFTALLQKIDIRKRLFIFEHNGECYDFSMRTAQCLDQAGPMKDWLIYIPDVRDEL